MENIDNIIWRSCKDDPPRENRSVYVYARVIYHYRYGRIEEKGIYITSSLCGGVWDTSDLEEMDYIVGYNLVSWCPLGRYEYSAEEASDRYRELLRLISKDYPDITKGWDSESKDLCSLEIDSGERVFKITQGIKTYSIPEEIYVSYFGRL